MRESEGKEKGGEKEERRRERGVEEEECAPPHIASSPRSTGEVVVMPVETTDTNVCTEP